MALVTLTVVSNDSEAEMLCGLLQSNGIACSYEKAGAAAGLGAVYYGTAGPTAVLVDSAELEEAQKLLPPAQP